MALRRHVPGPAWIATAVNAAATVGVAASPLEHSGLVDAAHTAHGHNRVRVAGAHPPAGRPAPLRRRPPRPGPGVGGHGVAVGACLAATAGMESSGLPQRLGLTIGDAWLVAAGLAIVGRPSPVGACGTGRPGARCDVTR